MELANIWNGSGGTEQALKSRPNAIIIEITTTDRNRLFGRTEERDRATDETVRQGGCNPFDHIGRPGQFGRWAAFGIDAVLAIATRLRMNRANAT